MPRYIIQKEVEAKSLSEALKKEKEAEVTYIDKANPPEQPQGQYNTHAIGFHVAQDDDW